VVLLTPESVSSLASTRNMTTTVLRSRLPSLVAGGRRYAVQRTAPKFARFMATPSADVSPLPQSQRVSCVGWLSLSRRGCVQLRKTGLYDFHVANGAKMVPFAGYSMPLSYGSVGAGELSQLVYYLTRTRASDTAFPFSSRQSPSCTKQSRSIRRRPHGPNQVRRQPLTLVI